MNSHMSFSFLFFFIAFSNLIVFSYEKTNTTFKPKHEWQKVEEEERVPSGLSVGFDLPINSEKSEFQDESEAKSMVDNTDYKKDGRDEIMFNPDELKNILKKIKPDDDSLKEDTVASKFRSYEDLKKDFDELNMKFQTDIEILSHLIENFKKFDLPKSNKENIKTNDETDDEEILSTLVDLEYLVHQFDNANEFARQNGFSEVIHKSLNSSNSEIRSEALRLHGSATQSNPSVQIAALDSGSINLLLKILSFDEDHNVRSRSLYALSCLVRQFPAAQHKLVLDGGLTVFASIFDEKKQDLLKLQVKIITLIHDLLLERKDTKMNILEEEENINQTNQKLIDLKEKLRQYEKINIEKKLVEQNWCLRISNWIVKQNLMSEFRNDIFKEKDFTPSNSDHHDLIEKIVDVVYVLSDICKPQFQGEKELVELIYDLRNVYSELSRTETSKDDDSGQFYSSLSNILEILKDKLKGKVLVKEEL